MARPFTGEMHVGVAQAMCRQAKTARQLRQALALLLPLAYGHTLEQTAQILGRSCREINRLRIEFVAEQEGRGKKRVSTSTRRIKQQRKESAILDELLPMAAESGMVTIPQLKPLLEKRLGKKLCLASVYNLLHRHGWRKPAPDTAREDGEKTSQNRWQKSKPRL